MPRILVLDEQDVYRSGLRSLIGAKIPNAEVIEAADRNEASSQIRTGHFDLVLVGTGRSGLGQLDFLQMCRETAPKSRFAIMSPTFLPAWLPDFTASFRSTSLTPKFLPPSTTSCPDGFMSRPQSPKTTMATHSKAIAAAKCRRCRQSRS